MCESLMKRPPYNSQIALFHQANDWIYGAHVYSGVPNQLLTWGPFL